MKKSTVWIKSLDYKKMFRALKEAQACLGKGQRFEIVF